jgi:hypothetical protein
VCGCAYVRARARVCVSVCVCVRERESVCVCVVVVVVVVVGGGGGIMWMGVIERLYRGDTVRLKWMHAYEVEVLWSWIVVRAHARLRV